MPSSILNDLPPNDLLAFRERIRARALEMNFSRVGFTSAEPLAPAERRRWERWKGEDKAGVMRYLMRERPRRTHPRDLMDEAETALVVAAAYYDGDHPDPPGDKGVTGKIARYAWGRDYHAVLREWMVRLGEWIDLNARRMKLAKKVLFRPCVDSAPLDERALAVRAGLGFIGKNTLLLDPQGGSWSVLGVLLISIQLPPDSPLADPAATCGGCRLCLEACPTSAFDGPYQLDPRRCTSYLTIEQKEEIAPEIAEKMNGWAFGCDICQEVCPFNERPLERLLPGLAATEGAGPYLNQSMLDDARSGKGLVRQWGHTPLARPGLKGLRRNLSAVAGASDEKKG